MCVYVCVVWSDKETEKDRKRMRERETKTHRERERAFCVYSDKFLTVGISGLFLHNLKSPLYIRDVST